MISFDFEKEVYIDAETLEVLGKTEDEVFETMLLKRNKKLEDLINKEKEEQIGGATFGDLN